MNNALNLVTTDNLDIRAMAAEVVATLGSLESYLSTSLNPDRVALADLRMGNMGWTELTHSPKAFEIWYRQHELDHTDSLTMHHLAIMHHARAFDLEMARKPTNANEDWKTALDFWYRLHGCDAFWVGLADKACSGAIDRKGVYDLRAALPTLLLGIHYDIALDEKTRKDRKSRAKFHIALAQNSSFDAQSRAAARDVAYAKFIKAIPDDVWQMDESREERIAEGTNVIEEYLRFDPGCQAALEDTLGLQRRMQRSRNIRWISLGQDDPERIQILAAERRDFEHWHPYFKQLVEMRAQLGEDVRENVAAWYFGCGDSLCAYDKEEQALECFETAILVCNDDDDRKRFLRRLVQTLAYVAREKADNTESGARAYCDRVRMRQDLTVLACFLLVQAYLSLFDNVPEDDFELLDIAEAICHRGGMIEPDFDDRQADEYREPLKSFLKIICQRRGAANIRTLLHSDRHQEAIELSRSALEASEMAGHDGGTPALRKELSMVLTVSAIDLANKSQTTAMTELKKNPFTRETSFALLNQQMEEVEEMLEEALQLDGSNAKATETLTQVQEAMNQLS